jgi:PPOX class probable F420-dependent enzyme
VQLNPVWFELKDGFIWLNSNTSRTWPKNLQRDRDVTMLLVDPKMPDRYAQIRGRLVSLIPDPEHEFIDHLAERYTGKKFRDLEPDEHRVTLKIHPVKVTGAMI